MPARPSPSADLGSGIPVRHDAHRSVVRPGGERSRWNILSRTRRPAPARKRGHRAVEVSTIPPFRSWRRSSAPREYYRRPIPRPCRRSRSSTSSGCPRARRCRTSGSTPAWGKGRHICAPGFRPRSLRPDASDRAIDQAVFNVSAFPAPISASDSATQDACYERIASASAMSRFISACLVGS